MIFMEIHLTHRNYKARVLQSSSDGIYWKDTKTGHLVHISGWYNRVQVENGRFEEACELTGVKLEYIKNGRYIDSGVVKNKILNEK